MTDLYAHTLTNGGATLNVRTGALLQPGTVRTPHADAYAVGDGRLGRTAPADSRESFAAALAAVLANGTLYVGTWVDDGTIYVDPVDIIWDRAEAIALGIARGEQAIFNLGTAETVDLTEQAA